MPETMMLAMFVDAVAIPMLALWALLAVKLTVGEPLQRAQRRFLIALVVVSLVTIRTVAVMDDSWLIHMLTLASMVIGACVLPSRSEMIGSAHA